MSWNIRQCLPGILALGRVAASAAAVAAAGLVVAAESPQAASPSQAALQVLLKPVMQDSAIVAIEVRETLANIAGQPGTPLFELPLVTANVPTVAETLTDLVVRDGLGEVPITSRDEPAAGRTLRRWLPMRATSGPIAVSYRVAPATALAPRGAAPPLELKASGASISGGSAVAVLRPTVAQMTIGFQWDLSAVGAGAIAAHSLAADPGALQAVGALEDIYLMAGRLGHYPAQRNSQGFFAVWQGEPPFDGTALMRWTETLHAAYLKFFGAPAAPYTVFMRENLVNAGGGIGMERSFVTTFGAGHGGDPEELKFTLAHEMFHTFQPMLQASEGRDGNLAMSWFNEGLAVFYQRVLPLRSGLIDSRAFLENLNYHAARYYTSSMGNLPNSEVPARFWQDTRVRTLPYDRGSLYLATVDEAIRRGSAGRRSLDDLMLQLLARQEAGHALTDADWERSLREELGEAGVRAYRAMLAGATPLPGSQAFGPCFRRVSRKLRRYQLGFEPKVLTESPRIVRGLLAGSNAALAGLKDGDEITRPVPQDDLQGRQDGVLRLEIVRAGVPSVISYLPRAELVPAWQWEAVPGRCEH